jgi:hypothetical protein
MEDYRSVNIRATLLLLCASVLWPGSVYSETVLDAKPTARVVAGDRTTKHSQLSEDEQTEYRILIVRTGGRYFWVTRQNRELDHRVSGAFHYFIDPLGGGYIKVLDTRALPESLRDPGPRFHYMEHLVTWLNTITYWGASETFVVPDDSHQMRRHETPENEP